MSSASSVLTSKIVDYLLRLPNCFAYRSNTLGIPTSSGSFRPSPKRGVPDITAMIKGKSFFIEVKIGKDSLRDEQKSFIASAHNAGSVVLVVKSFDDFIDQFSKSIIQ